jgi:hypothetical protein
LEGDGGESVHFKVTFVDAFRGGFSGIGIFCRLSDEVGAFVDGIIGYNVDSVDWVCVKFMLACAGAMSCYGMSERVDYLHELGNTLQGYCIRWIG